MVREQQAGRRAVTPAALGAFFALATALTLAAGVSLLTPGGQLDWIWGIKPAEHAQLLAMGPAVGAGFLGLCLVMALASVGGFTRRLWGWRLGLAIFVLNALGDASRLFAGAVAEGLVGIAVAAAIVWWLTRPRVRALFTA